MPTMNNIADNTQTPPCTHYGTCGGCSLQHLSQSAYYSFKKELILNIIDEIGLDNNIVSDVVKIGQHSRRRADFKIEVVKGEIKIGFYAAKSHDVVEINQCPVSENSLVQFLPKLKNILSSLKKPGAVKSVSVTDLDNGLDVIVITKTPLKASDKQKLLNAAKEHNIIRLSEKEDNKRANCIFDSNMAKVNFSNYEVELPVGAFLQATIKGQNEITHIVKKFANDSKKIADLFSGCGTYSFPLVDKADYIACYEGGYEMVMATNNTANKYGIANKLLAKNRDLFTDPLNDSELNNFDAVVINPPRAGAQNQAKQIAKSTVAKIIMVSCSPSSFKKDAKILLKGGYKLTKVIPIDQFYWSGHLELVAIFVK